MSHFLNGVRVINVLAAGGPAATSDNASPTVSPGYIVETPPPSTPSKDRHSSHDDIPVFAVPITAIVCTFIYLTIKAIVAPFRERSRFARAQQAAGTGGGGGLTEEEVAVLHKLQRTLTQMESRVESLETILIEQARSEKKYGSKL